ncbi:GNAT family N-acetyltransferase [Actinacidiphila oryziradicis]|jgi:predicted GNAT family acetyltransferase|uniref:GNAT family N-acetyltransferase n=1 Tax=Actinacidiphila oryziradicis TaxID=2571141 RepID=UPI0023EFDCD9|nr:GNAT family N-acetyltransferase [Actinacidiphila oryziradicis]MCW2872414.1 acetyltransferase [Actinacidiphila oryziradicis]
MAWNITGDLDAFLAAAGGFLRARPAQNTVLLTLTDQLRTRGLTAYGNEPPLFGWWTGIDGAVGGAFLQTPPYHVNLGTVPEAAAVALAGTWDAAQPLPGIAAEDRTAEAFTAAWQARTGAGAGIAQRQRLYRLGELTPVRPAPLGRARVAGPADRELLVRWYDAFADALRSPRGNHADAVDDRITHGGLTLWEADGQPVAMAGASRLIARSVRVAPVYTPPGLRGHGYAGAATAAVSQAALDAGADEVLLFTDLANPTSNALYQRLGYRPVDDRTVVIFT